MSCPFCSIPKEQLILENELAQAFYDKYPVQKGHLLIVPKRHAETYFDATPEEILAIHQLIRQGKEMMERRTIRMATISE